MIETVIIILVLIFSVVLHELAHGWVADLCGDPTAKKLGRLTLNPIPHLDLFGSVLIPLFLILSHAGFFIGWAKPIPVVPTNFRKYRRDNILVSLAGPGANIFIATVATIFIIMQFHSELHPLNEQAPTFARSLYTILYKTLSLNVLLAVFNLLPFPPLDGSHVLFSLLPQKFLTHVNKIGIAGVVVLLLIMNIPQVRSLFLQVITWCKIPFLYLIQLTT